jgi:hypothetical protein
VEVFCRCDPQVAVQRYALRTGSRDAGHFDSDRVIQELWNEEVAQPVAGGWPVIEVDAGSPVDVEQVIEAIRTAAGTAPPC